MSVLILSKYDKKGNAKMLRWLLRFLARPDLGKAFKIAFVHTSTQPIREKFPHAK